MKNKCCGRYRSEDRGQSRKMSAAEVAASTAIGYVVAVCSQQVIFPLFGVYVPFHDNLLMGLFFTVISVIRGYIVRRVFNAIKR